LGEKGAGWQSLLTGRWEDGIFSEVKKKRKGLVWAVKSQKRERSVSGGRLGLPTGIRPCILKLEDLPGAVSFPVTRKVTSPDGRRK